MLKFINVALCFYILLNNFSYASSLDGVSMHYKNLKDFGSNQVIDVLKSSDINSVRLDFPWKKVELHTKKYDFPEYDFKDLIKKLHNNNIKPLLILGYGNGIYHIGRPNKASDIAHFSDYAEWTAKQFTEEVNLYEIWNEWPHKLTTSSSYPDSAQNYESAKNYFELVKAVSLKIKSINPHAKIIIGSLNPFNKYQVAWLNKIIEFGVMNYADGVSIHPYIYSERNVLSPDDFISKIDLFESSISKLNLNKRGVDLYITEFGYPSNHSNGLSDEEISNTSKRIIFLTKQRSYIKGLWWYDLVDDGDSKLDRESNFGLFNTKLSPKPVSSIFK